MHLAVVGGTGLVGRLVVEEARQRGHEVSVLSRSAGVDLAADPAVVTARLIALLAGVEVVVDVSNTTTQSRAAAEAFFGGVTRTLLAAEEAAGVHRHLALSIVGIDRVASGYYAGKLRQEQVLAEGAVPWTVLRATQFHEFSEQALGFARIGPVSLVPRMRSRPVAAAEVAAHLVRLAEGRPGGRVPDLAGPAEHDVVDMARRVSAARGLGRRVIGVPLPGGAGRAMRSGGLLPQEDGPRGTLTFDDWLAATS